MQYRIKGLEVLRKMLYTPHLKDFAVSMSEQVMEFMVAPAFNERCTAGELVVDYTIVCGWEWTNKYATETILLVLREGTVPIRKSMVKTSMKPSTRITGMSCWQMA